MKGQVAGFFYNMLNMMCGTLGSFREEIIGNLPQKSNLRVLDWGCGTGLFCTIFQPDNYLGIDIDPKRIEYAKKHYKKYAFRCVKPNGKNDLGRFDVVLLSGVLHHMSESVISESMENILSYLEPNGRIIAIEPTITGIRFRDILISTLDRGKYMRNSKEYSHFFNPHFNVKVKPIVLPFLSRIWSSDYLYIMDRKD